MMIASTSSTFCARRHAGAERADGAVEQAAGERVALVERARPHAAGQPRAAALLHDLEEDGLLAAVGAPARAGLHRGAAGVGLHAAAAAAAAQGAADADHDVADLAGDVAADPGLAVEHDAAADAGAPEHAEQRVVRAAGAERELRVGRHLDVVAERHRRAARLLERRRMSKLPSQPGRFLAADTVPAASSTLPGEPMPMPSSDDGLDARLGGRVLERAGDLRRYAGRTAGRRRRATRLAGDVAALVDDDRLDLGASEIDSAGVSHAEGVPDRNVSCVTGSSRRGISVTVIARICSYRRLQRDIPCRGAGGGTQIAFGRGLLEPSSRRSSRVRSTGSRLRAMRSRIQVSVAASPRSAARWPARASPRARRVHSAKRARSISSGGRCWSWRSSFASAIANRSPDRSARRNAATRRGGAPRRRSEASAPDPRRWGRRAPSPRGRPPAERNSP